ncbi:MAG TPA: sigma-70 family RNA polymerase sigma factor [Bryobacteraceae bacterium]|nr:sigma-70 family RNA polymerase sigma factor [Bryobacteraceae bacterium]
MASSSSHTVTLLLRRWSQGDRSALDLLSPLVYHELHQLADNYMRREQPGHTLQPTALIHEAYLRLVEQEQKFECRHHFYGVAAHLMRMILVDHARVNCAEKRGGGRKDVSLDHAPAISKEHFEGLLDLEQALSELATFDKRKSEMVEMRFFAGLSPEEIAGLLDVSAPTVFRELKLAKAWLRRRLS